VVTGVVSVIIGIVLAIVLGWLTSRAWRLRNTALRIVVGFVSGLLTLVLTIVSIVGLAGVYRLYAPHGSPPIAITASATPDRLAVAARRATGCAGCHSSAGNLPMDGGSTNFLAGLGTLVAPNLTPGGPLKGWSDGEIVRAIREGVDRLGHPLIIMPSDAFHHLSDDDVSTLVAYMRSEPAVNHATPDRDLSLPALVLIGAGLFPTAEQPHISAPQIAPPPGTPAYGQYLVDITGCAACHGPDLRGRAPGGFGPPAGPDLRAIVPAWQEDAFVRFFRTGQDPNGRSIDNAAMPWKDIGQAVTDDELRAIYTYLHSLT
jgi:mono/diheme cytochrome c family protein